jgi:hypothetical protein
MRGFLNRGLVDVVTIVVAELILVVLFGNQFLHNWRLLAGAVLLAGSILNFQQVFRLLYGGLRTAGELASLGPESVFSFLSLTATISEIAFAAAHFATVSEVLLILAVGLVISTPLMSRGIAQQVALINSGTSAQSPHLVWEVQLKELASEDLNSDTRRRLVEISESCRYLTASINGHATSENIRIDECIRSIEESIRSGDEGATTTFMNSLEALLRMRENKMKLNRGN